MSHRYRQRTRWMNLVALIALLPGWWANAKAADSGETARLPTIYVEVQGSLQGATSDELPGIFAAKMAEVPAGAWHFVPAASGGHAPNRIEWSLTRGADASGALRTYGFSRTMMARLVGAHRVIALEAKVYLNDRYQGTVSGQIRDAGNPRDPEIGSKVSELTRELLSPAVLGTSDLGPTHRSGS